MWVAVGRQDDVLLDSELPVLRQDWIHRFVPYRQLLDEGSWARGKEGMFHTRPSVAMHAHRSK